MSDRENLIEKIDAVSFTPARTRSSYDMTHVDDFLDALVVALRQGRDIEPLVDMVRFSTVRFREGYDTREVDRFLDQVVAASHQLTPETAAERAARRPVSPDPVDDAVLETEEPVPDSYTAAPGVIEERRGLLSRLFQR